MPFAHLCGFILFPFERSFNFLNIRFKCFVNLYLVFYYFASVQYGCMIFITYNLPILEEEESVCFLARYIAT